MLSGRALTALFASAAGALLILGTYAASKEVRPYVAGGGFAAIVFGVGIGSCWRKPPSQSVKETADRLEGAFLGHIENNVTSQLKPAPWTLNAVDVDATYQVEPVSNPTHDAHSPLVSELSNPTNELVSELSNPLSESESLFNFDLDPNPWELTNSLSEDAEHAR